MLATTTSNYEFLNNSFREAKRGQLLEMQEREKLNDPMYVNPNRLRGVGLEGGSRSGKTWDASIFVCEYMNTFTGKTILISRDMLTRLKKTTYQTLKKVWMNFHGNTKPFNQSATPINYNGNTIFFSGINEDAMLAHGLETDLAWVNESMNCKKETVFEIIRRCNEFYILDYNPSAVKSWCFEMERTKSHRIHKSTALTNTYCPANARIEILSYEPTHPEDRHLEESERRPHPINVEAGTADFYMWQVYGLGMRGKSEDLIFPNYKVYHDEDEPSDDECDVVAYGGDFGTDAPNVLVKTKRKGNDLYLKEVIRLYLKLGSTDQTASEQLASEIKAKGLENELQIWDSAEKKSITDLQIQGVRAVRAKKGTDSVHYGLKKMRASNIFVHAESTELIKEMDGYVWAKMANGEYMTNTKGHKMPYKKDDHSIDASRYADSYFYYQ